MVLMLMDHPGELRVVGQQRTQLYSGDNSMIKRLLVKKLVMVAV